MNHHKKTFLQIIEEYNSCSKSNYIEKTPYNYSNHNFLACKDDEKIKFFNEILKKISITITNNITLKEGSKSSFADIMSLLFNDSYANMLKNNRKVCFSSTSGNRPIGELGWTMWNGLQIIDLDIKDRSNAELLKEYIFAELKTYSWFLGVCFSASGKGLHVWTKITPKTFENDIINNKKKEFMINFRHKYSFVFMSIMKHISDINIDKGDVISYLDMAMAKPQQGIFISSDKSAYFNTYFVDNELDFDLECNKSSKDYDWAHSRDLDAMFIKQEFFNSNKGEKHNQVSINDCDLSVERNMSHNKIKHYKHRQRWQLANTLVKIYGAEKAEDILYSICDDSTPKSELLGDIKTASLYDKPISVWAINELNRYHGFKIKVNTIAESNDLNNMYASQIDNNGEILDPCKILNDSSEIKVLSMSDTQYLSDIKVDILKSLGKLTLLEAGAGYGKTEMIKRFGEKTLLILPFTSTIKAKIESESIINEKGDIKHKNGWAYYYGKSVPEIWELAGSENVAMTIDKFSQLNPMELELCNFKYVVVDESHLLFTSKYRDVMSNTIKLIANMGNRIKTILMTGTPTGEMLFFPNITHIKVNKIDNRQKNIDFVFSQTKDTSFMELCRNLTQDFLDGKRILFPTNKGISFFNKVKKTVETMLVSLGNNKKPKMFYYKKSNYGKKGMDDINNKKTIGDTDILLCSTYLSVGVDICDKKPFNVYFDEQWIAQDIEQFSNRLRNNDLHIKMFLPKEDNNGNIINYDYTVPLDLSIDKDDLILSANICNSCNQLLQRNEDEQKYNPLIANLIKSNKYVKYDEDTCTYYLEETTYKLHLFEDRYKQFATQLNVIINGMKYYGYTINKIDNNITISDKELGELKTILEHVKEEQYNEETMQTFEFLSHINDDNIELYRDLLHGNYDLFTSSKFKSEQLEHDLYCNSIDIIEKNTPYIVSLYNSFDIDVIVDIFKYCINTKKNKINYAKLERICKLMKINRNIVNYKIDLPILKYIRDTKAFVDEREGLEVEKSEVKTYIENYTKTYINSIKNIYANSEKFTEVINDNLSNLFKVLVSSEKAKKSKHIYLKNEESLWETKQIGNILLGKSLTEQFFFLNENYKSEHINVDANSVNINIPENIFEEEPKLSINDFDEHKLISENFDFYNYSLNNDKNDKLLKYYKDNNRLIINKNKKDEIKEDNYESNKEQSLFSEVI